MQYDNLNEVFAATLNNTLASIALFIPRFLTGLIVLLVGLIIAGFVKQALLRLFKVVYVEQLLEKYGVPEKGAKEGMSWSVFLAELARWIVIIIFLVPTANLWGIGQFATVLNNLLAYIPNVLVSALILLVGIVASKLVYDLLRASVNGVSPDSARTIAAAGRYAVIIFAVLIALNQLGIASDLIRILFAGIVAMVALAGGLAFGLGGREAAKEVLEKLAKKL